MFKYLIDTMLGILSSFLSGIKFVCNFTFGTANEVDKTVQKIKNENEETE